MKKLIVIVIILFNCLSSFANNDIKQFFNAIKRSNYFSAKVIIDKVDNKDLRNELDLFYDIMKGNRINVLVKKTKNSIDTLSLSYNISLLNKALVEYLKDGNETKSFQTLKKAFNLSKKRNDNILICETLKIILEIYQRFTSVIGDESYKYYISEYKKYAYDDFEIKNYILKEFKLIKKQHYNTKKKYNSDFKEVNKTLLNINSIILQAKRDITFSAYFRYEEEDLVKSEILIREAIKKLETLEGIFEQERLICAKINLAIVLFEKRSFNEALNIINNIDINQNIYIYKLLKIFLYYWKYEIHKSLGNIKQSKDYYIKYLELELLHDQSKKKQLVSEFETKYQTLEKEKKIVQLLNTNLKSEAERINNRNWLIGSSSALVIGLIIAILVYKNTKRKQRIAEQEREIEIQKTEKLLKEQELTAIDAMISGQEKERQRLANDLHDNLGSTLATVKLHFDHLKNNRNNPKVENIEELYSKTNNLLDEAYQKVRTIAHEKNSGVMAKQGLLPAVRNLAKKASNGNRLQIEVQDYGLNERLDNALEISIFRIIQELITNTIKHAGASEIGISLTNHDSLLNIIVEDNGKGFNAKVLPEKDGMGLKSIEKRIEHLEGTFEIDSTIGKGTNIIINIPI
ncbi:sensor histidine kinase [uncultured Aquimarina sp.]|uniref:sensor histidine kinase n=1 Tax=uncultured Aquimarina sp. TaxID=575652 RepID=UPI00261764A6|nr:sensor histidine kinase [uncultured Aquimarina sp.]